MSNGASSEDQPSPRSLAEERRERRKSWNPFAKRTGGRFAGIFAADPSSSSSLNGENEGSTAPAPAPAPASAASTSTGASRPSLSSSNSGSRSQSGRPPHMSFRDMRQEKAEHERKEREREEEHGRRSRLSSPSLGASQPPPPQSTQYIDKRLDPPKQRAAAVVGCRFLSFVHKQTVTRSALAGSAGSCEHNGGPPRPGLVARLPLRNYPRYG